MASELTPIDPESPDADEESGDLLRPEPTPVRRRRGGDEVLSRYEMMYMGPIPPPAMLKQFDKINPVPFETRGPDGQYSGKTFNNFWFQTERGLAPGLAEKIVENTLEQSRHRRELEKHVVEENTKSRKLGMYIGGGLGFTALVGAVVTAGMGQPWVAGGLVGAVTGGLVTSFFGSYKRQKAEIEAKATAKDRMTSPPNPESPESPKSPEHS